MFPRNIRRIYPWKIAQILSLFQELLADGEWSGNQELQNNFCKALESAGLKSPGEQYDPHSGGPRTYLSQLKCLGLIFQRPDNSIWLTKAGEDLAQGKPPLPIIQQLLLKHQYPSVYGNLRGVRIHSGIRVKPFVFVLRLLQDKRLGYLTNKELIIPVVYGHNNQCFELCVEKILQVRNGKNLERVITSKEDLYTTRSRKRALKDGITDARDIANTTKNYMQAACLIDVDRVEGQEKIYISEAAIELLKKCRPAEKKFIPLGPAEESFQRAYGCLDAKKDTRMLTRRTKRSTTSESIIKAMFMQYCGEHLFTDMPEDFVEQMKKNFGFDETEIRRVVEPFIKRSLTYFESTFLEYSRGGQATADNFEKAVCYLFRERLLFETELTAKKKRPMGGVGGYADVFLKALDGKHCSIVDAKASPNYNLSSADFTKMTGNYIPNYTELAPGESLDLEFCLYIGGGFFERGMKQKIKKLKKISGKNISAISAYEFLKLAKDRISSSKQVKIRQVFRRNEILKADQFV